MPVIQIKNKCNITELKRFELFYTKQTEMAQLPDSSYIKFACGPK